MSGHDPTHRRRPRCLLFIPCISNITIIKRQIFGHNVKTKMADIPWYKTEYYATLSLSRGQSRLVLSEPTVTGWNNLPSSTLSSVSTFAAIFRVFWTAPSGTAQPKFIFSSTFIQRPSCIFLPISYYRIVNCWVTLIMDYETKHLNIVSCFEKKINSEQLAMVW